MDAVELLARENEFKRLNKQLEKKTESLMKEIEHVMQKQDFFSEFSPSLMMPSQQNYKKHCCTPPSQPDTPIKKCSKKNTLRLGAPKSIDSEDSEYECKSPKDSQRLDSGGNTLKNRKSAEFDTKKLKSKRSLDVERKTRRGSYDSKTQSKVICECCPHTRATKSDELQFLYAFVNINVKDKVLPSSFSKEDKITVESVCKFLSSKIKLMQEQIDKLQCSIEKRASQCESHLTQLAELESERMTLLNRTNNMKSSTADTRAKCLATQKRLDEKDKMYKELRSEADKQSSELKRLRAKNAAVEAKCASHEQLVDTLKQQLDISKRSEKEYRDSTRQLSATYESAISRLEAQISALTMRTDKQTALINNLRKQNALLITEGAVDALNIDYAGLLNQDF